MTTNDPQAGYVAEQREPMLNDRAVSSMQKSYQFLFSGHDELNSEAWLIGALDMRKAYENLITSGELIVSKTVKRSDLKNAGPVSAGGDYLECQCGGFIYETGDKFCPGCGARIIE